MAPKTVIQQFRAAVFRKRERLIYQRIGDVNALQALLCEHGQVFPIRTYDHAPRHQIRERRSMDKNR